MHDGADDRGEVAIGVAIDDRYVPHFAACVASIAASRGPEGVRFYVLQGSTLSAESVRRLGEFVSELGMEFETVEITEDLAASLPPTQFYAPIVWYRLLFPEVLPHLDRILVLDVDLLVLQSLWPLYSQDLGTDLLAAVGTSAGAVDTASVARIRGLGLDLDAPYLNTGVMLMNLRAMRDERVGPRVIAFGHERAGALVFPEQDALNAIAAGRWRMLHPRWNAMSHLWLIRHAPDPMYPELDQESARLSPAIVHFEGFHTVKPWFYRSVHPLRHLYREYRSQTPWPLETLEGKSASARILRVLPLRWQYAITRGKSRVSARLARR
jgi:lipopolysaccharide biosynthesis glycosyltransferase